MNRPVDIPPVAQTERAQYSQRRTKILIAGVALAAIVVGIILTQFKSTRPAQSATSDTPAAKGSFKPSKAQMESLAIEPVSAVSFRDEQITDGMIANNDDTSTPVYSPYSGHVSKLFAKLGDVVAKGAPLMAVEASEFVQGQSDLIAAVGALNTARSQVALMESAEKRQHELFLAKAGAQKDWLQSQTDLISAQSGLRSAEIALGAVRNRLRILGKTDAEITAIESGSALQKMNPEAIVRAPIAGTVISRQVGLGQNIQSAASGAYTPVYTVANLSTVWLIANVRETDAPYVKIGAPVEVQVSAFPKRTFKAKLTWIAPAVDPNTHRLPVRAEIDNHDGALKPMMFASFRILTGDSITAPGITQNAIVYEGANAHVFVAGKDGSLTIRPIRTGRTSGNVVEVVEGLALGERVVTSGALFIDRAVQAN